MEYHELSEKCSQLSADLLDQCRTTDEVETLLKRKEGFVLSDHHKLFKYPRVELAVDLDQKKVRTSLIFLCTFL